MQLLKFIFESFWHFLGMLIFLIVILWGIITIIATVYDKKLSLRSVDVLEAEAKKEGFEDLTDIQEEIELSDRMKDYWQTMDDFRKENVNKESQAKIDRAWRDAFKREGES